MKNPVLPKQSRNVRCDSCSGVTPSYDIVNYGSIERGYRRLCCQCYNKEVAEECGLTRFEDAKFEPLSLTDATGKIHEFRFRTHLFVTGVSIDAFELREGYPSGYQFQIIADPEEDLLAMFGRLVERMRRALSTKHLAKGEYGFQIADHRTVRGRIEWDAHDNDVPLLVIDGREIGWSEFGRMLMSFEGWQFKLSIVDKSQEV